MTVAVNRHARRSAETRRRFIATAQRLFALTPAVTAARVLVTTLEQYLGAHPEGVYYAQMLSQLAATNSNRTNPQSRSRLNFRDIPGLERLMAAPARD